ncbi:MAG TPA: Tad domain-containing protein [Acidobacteriota bacterium]|nr:Tad domain-containing protein [Acidobacteriota bacterium]
MMKNRQSQKGYVAVTLAASLVVLLGFAALAVDLGVLYSARTSAQRVADASSLAGAFTFIVNPAADEDRIRSQAIAAASTNEILGESVVVLEEDVDVDMANRRVTVTVHRTADRGNPIGTFFARALTISSADIRALGTAEASDIAVGSLCTKPWMVPNSIISSIFDPALSPCQAQEAGLVIFDRDAGTGDYVISAVAQGLFDSYAAGTEPLQFTVKPGDPKQALAPSDFYAIQIGSTGGKNYRENIAGCADVAVSCLDLYSVETGNMQGPTALGTNELIGDPPDTFEGVGLYRSADGTLSETSRSLIIAPVWDLEAMPGFCPDNTAPSGTNTVFQVAGFVLLYVEGVTPKGPDQGDVIVRLIRAFPCGGLAVDTEETGPFSVPLRLVKLPDES